MSTFMHLLCGLYLAVAVSNAMSVPPQQLRSVVVGEFEGITRSNFSRQRENGTALDCQLQCLKDEECMSFFYNRYSGTCQTHDVVFFNSSDGLLSPGNQYYRQVQDLCPSDLGYIYSRSLDLCYKFHYLNAFNYSYANRICYTEGGRLVIADNVEKLYHLGRTIRSSTFLPIDFPGFIVGATDKLAEGEWRWSDGQKLPMPDKRYWCPGRPNNFGPGEDYVKLETSSELPGCLSDISEIDPKYFICERPM